ncbi:MAG: family transcriptional regulator, cyclic receptor protein [Thermomicrobiales bacterium]|nr:family transcriptional regulator, cyclic receptor protein [Thermomicrobiales bacterium]
MVCTARLNPPSHRLSEVPFFAGLSSTLLDQLAVAGRVRRYPAGQVLFSEGDPDDGLVVREAGELRVSRFTPTGHEAVLTVAEAPAALGELALLDGNPRVASVTAQRPVVVRLVPRSAFLELVRGEPAFVEGLLATLAGWVRLANARHADLLGLDVPGRLAKWLLARTEREGTSMFEIGRTQGELAAELGTTRSTLNRALQELGSLGAIETDGERVTILKPDALRAFLG